MGQLHNSASILLHYSKRNYIK